MIRTFTGKNSFVLQADLKQLVSEIETEVGEFGVERFDASETEVDTLLQVVQSLPFLVSKKLIIISNIQANNALMERLEELVDRTADAVELVLVEPNLDKRRSSYKILQKLTKLHDFSNVSVNELPKWIVSQARDAGAKISTSDAVYLAERVGADQQLLAQEIDKLALYDTSISKETIDLLTEESIQSTIFSLLDAAFAGNNKKAIELYKEQRTARIEPHYIVAMLVWQLQAISLAVFAQPKTEKVLVEAGQSPYTARKALSTARNLTKSQVKKMIVDLSELDAQIKTVADPDAAIELYLLNL